MDETLKLSSEEWTGLYMVFADELLKEAHEVAQRTEDRVDELMKGDTAQ